MAVAPDHDHNYCPVPGGATSSRKSFHKLVVVATHGVHVLCFLFNTLVQSPRLAVTHAMIRSCGMTDVNNGEHRREAIWIMTRAVGYASTNVE